MFTLKHYHERASTIAELLAGSVGTVISFAPEEEVLGEGDPTENFFLVSTASIVSLWVSSGSRPQKANTWQRTSGVNFTARKRPPMNAAMAILPRRYRR
jgi:hypothetical protein